MRSSAEHLMVRKYCQEKRKERQKETKKERKKGEEEEKKTHRYVNGNSHDECISSCRTLQDQSKKKNYLTNL